MIRMGILGAARIAREAIFEPAPAQEGLTVTAIASRSRARAESLAEEWGVPGVSATYAELIDDPEVDAVYIGLPPSEHKHWTIAALRTGKHVLCEKPFAMNAKEAAEMEAAAQRSGLVLMEAFHYRFHPLFAKVLEIVTSGALGAPLHVHAHFNVPVPDSDNEFRYQPTLGGGALMDLGCYPIHWARTLMAAEPQVLGSTMSLHTAGVDESFEARLSFGDDRSGFVAASMRADLPAGIDARISLLGELGDLFVDNPLAPQHGYRLVLRTTDEERDFTVEGGSTYKHQLGHFVDLVADRTAPILPAGDSTANMRVIDAIVQLSNS